MSIAVLTPSRSRPAQLAEMVEAIVATADGQVDVFVGIDDDDDSGYPVCAWHAGETCAIPFRRGRMQLGAWTNYLLGLALEDHHDIVASFGDDHRPRTQGWDTRVREAFDEMGSGLVYTADGLQDERLPTAPFWSADIIRELGWFFPPNQVHLYADDFWLAFSNAIGRRTYLPDVLIEHLHPSSGKAEADAVNVENDSHYDADRAAFVAYMAGGFAADVERVKEIL